MQFNSAELVELPVLFDDQGWGKPLYVKRGKKIMLSWCDQNRTRCAIKTGHAVRSKPDTLCDQKWTIVCDQKWNNCFWLIFPLH
jgi:hypothetical protein